MDPAAQPSQQAVQVPHSRFAVLAASRGGAAAPIARNGITAPQHLLNFLPLPQGQGSFLPGIIVVLHHEG